MKKIDYQNSLNQIIELTKTLPKNVKAARLAISLMILSALNSSYAQEENSVEKVTWDQQISLTETSNQVQQAKLISKSVGEKIDMVLVKKQLIELFNDFEWKKWIKDFDIYYQEFLLQAFLNLIKDWYQINWYQDLDELIKIINSLSKNEIKIKTWKSIPQNSEFKDNFIIEWDLKGKELKLEVEWGFDKFVRWVSDSEIKMEVNLSKMLDIYFDSLPDSLGAARDLNIKLQSSLLESENKLNELETKNKTQEFTIESLNLEIDKLQKQYEDTKLGLINKAKEEKENAEKKHKSEIEDLKKKHQEELEKKSNEITQKNTEIEEIKKTHQKEIEDLKKKQQEELKRLEDKNNENLIKLNQENQIKTNEIQKKLDEANIELESLKLAHKNEINLLNSQIDNFKKEIEKASVKITQLTNNITTLNLNIDNFKKEIENLKRDITSKKTQIDNLKTDKEKLNSQIGSIDTMKDELLNQAQLSLTESQKLNTTNENKIQSLEKELKQKEQKIVELEKYLELYNNSLTEITKLKESLDSIWKIAQSVPEKNNKITELNTEIQKLKSSLEKMEEIKSENERLKKLNSDLTQENKIVEDLKIEIKDLKTQIEFLTSENTRKDERLDSEAERIKQLWVQIEALNKKYWELIKTKANISNSKLVSEMAELNKNYSDLQKKYDDILEKYKLIQDENSKLKQQLAKSTQEIEDLKAQHKKRIEQLIKDQLTKK